MKTENLIKATDSMNFLCDELRRAHRDAINEENQFAVIILFQLFKDSLELQLKLADVMLAAAAEDNKS